MKKLGLVSVAAAVAVAGLSTSAFAATPMTEWAKDTTVSGYVRYRLHNDYETDKKGDTTEEAKAVLKFTSKVNDAVKANVKYVSAAETKDGEGTADTGVKEANFVVAAGGATVIAGLQTSQSPFFANNGDTRSHGVTALIPAGPVTVAAAHYFTTVGGGITKIDTTVPTAFTNNVTALGLIGDMGAFNFAAWYASVEDSADVEDVTGLSENVVGLKDASAMSVAVGAKVGPVMVDAMHTTVSHNDLDKGITKVAVSGKADAISYRVGYAMSMEDGGMVALDGDDDAVSDYGLHELAMSATTDSSAFHAGAGIKMGAVGLDLDVLSGSSDFHEDFSETDVKVSYKMSKNFKGYFKYFTGKDTADADFAGSRLEVKYSF